MIQFDYSDERRLELAKKAAREEALQEGSNALYNAIQKLKAGATQEDLKAEGFDEHIIELALACK